MIILLSLPLRLVREETTEACQTRVIPSGASTQMTEQAQRRMTAVG